MGVAAGFYLLAIRTFVGKVGSFEELYRMTTAYAFMVLMGIGIHSVYRTSFITTVVVALSGFVPVATALIFVTTLG